MHSRRPFAAGMLGGLLLATGCGGAPAAGNGDEPAKPGNAAQPATVGAQAQPGGSALAGRWHQSSPVCAGGDPAPMPVAELEFDADAAGRFAVTFVPFETYKDYWGRYRFDPASGALVLTVERGNAVPEDLDLDGRARFAADGELIVEDIAFGTPNGGGAERRDCPLRFRRD